MLNKFRKFFAEKLAYEGDYHLLSSMIFEVKSEFTFSDCMEAYKIIPDNYYSLVHDREISKHDFTIFEAIGIYLFNFPKIAA